MEGIEVFDERDFMIGESRMKFPNIDIYHIECNMIQLQQKMVQLEKRIEDLENRLEKYNQRKQEILEYDTSLLE